MSAPFGPFAFELTEDEARIAASRAALRRALAGGLTARHLAPLAAFLLAMAFTAILALTDLVSRRHGEIALLLEAAAFMIFRLAILRRFMTARRESAATIATIRAAGAVEADIDGAGVAIRGAGLDAQWRFADATEVEDAGGMIYLWMKSGPPACLPARVFPDETAARAFIAFAKPRIGHSTI